MFQESSIEGCGVQAGASYNSHSHYETRLYSHRCWAIPAMISEIQTPGKSIVSNIPMDHCIACLILNSWSWRWLRCFILFYSAIVGSRCEFYCVCWHQAQPGQCESCRKHFAMDQVGKEETVQILSIRKNKDNNNQKHEKQRKKIQETEIYLRYIMISNVG